jgi:hypothetical protein
MDGRNETYYCPSHSLLHSSFFLKQLLIKVPHPMPLSHSSQLGDILRDLLDGFNLSEQGRYFQQNILH